MDLTKKKCSPCEGGVKPLDKKSASALLKSVSGAWKLGEKGGVPRITRTFKFKNFVDAISFVVMVAKIAESEGHHPNIFIFYNKVELELYTHAIKGLHENDFILAAKIGAMHAGLSA